LKPAAALLALLAALLAAGCGTGGLSTGGDRDAGKKLFLDKCGGCHTLGDAGTHGTQGPDLDEAFRPSRDQGFEEVTIEQVVRDQIELASGAMPPNLVTGDDADSVAAYVASVLGKPVVGGDKQATSGKDIFTANCGSCHTLGEAGTNGTVGPNLDELAPPLATIVRQVENGGGAMPAFKGTLTDAQIQAVSKYVASVAGKG
jgi:cbb3-type cytochrome c oxidase subunit III